MNRKIYLQLFAEESDVQDNQNVQDEPKPEAKPEAKYTDEDIDRILNQKLARWREKAEKEQAEKLEAERLAKMTEDEKQKAEMERLRSELDALKHERGFQAMKTEARNMLAEQNIHVSDALLNNLVTADSADKTKNSVNEFVSLYKKAVADGIKEALKGKTPSSTTGKTGLSKEDILKVKDRTERQKLISENRGLFGAK